ncbi:MAG: antibiotic biosynthesis monooxygenase [Lentisphaeraceae bacterium]|nr:antibiotic biosynthesis monooxygenase [Lentisphaeraceae bacterium]
MSHLTVVATVTAKAGFEDEVGSILGKLVEPTLKEEGCINYDLHRSIENSAVYVFHENWESKAHLDAHLETAHIKQCQASLDGKTASTELYLLNKI